MMKSIDLRLALEEVEDELNKSSATLLKGDKKRYNRRAALEAIKHVRVHLDEVDYLLRQVPAVGEIIHDVVKPAKKAIPVPPQAKKAPKAKAQAPCKKDAE